jgi:hypothetical protein
LDDGRERDAAADFDAIVSVPPKNEREEDRKKGQKIGRAMLVCTNPGESKAHAACFDGIL